MYPTTRLDLSSIFIIRGRSEVHTNSFKMTTLSGLPIVETNIFTSSIDNVYKFTHNVLHSFLGNESHTIDLIKLPTKFKMENLHLKFRVEPLFSFEPTIIGMNIFIWNSTNYNYVHHEVDGTEERAQCIIYMEKLHDPEDDDITIRWRENMQESCLDLS